MGLIEEKQLSKYGQMVQFSEFIDFMVCYTNERDFDVANYLFESQEFCRLDFYTIESDGFTKTTYAEDIAGDEEGRGTISSFLYDVSIGDTLRDYYFYYWRIEDILAVTEIKFLELDLDKYKQYCYASSLHASSVIQIIEENSKLKENQSDLINAETSKELQLIVDNQAKEITDLKAKISQLEQKPGEPSQSDTPITIQRIDEGQGDSFLILGAIMETMNDFMNGRYGQTKHFNHIEQNFDGVGISASTVSKKVAKARKHFIQSTSPKKK